MIVNHFNLKCLLRDARMQLIVPSLVTKSRSVSKYSYKITADRPITTAECQFPSPEDIRQTKQNR